MFIHNLNPVLLEIGQLQIRYYGLFYVIGFILGYFFVKKISKEWKLSLSKQKIEDFLMYTGIAGIIGARLFYVLVYNGPYYLANPFDILAIWKGGLSFHGGLIGGIVGIYLFAKKYKFNFLQLLDILVIPFSLALGLGRIGNFINGELPGRITDVPWCVVFPGIDGCRHPSQLYESVYSFVIFGILWSIRNKRLKHGTIFSIFLLLYSSFRFITEFFREADAQLGYFYGLTMGQILNIAMFAVGSIMLYQTNKRK